MMQGNDSIEQNHPTARKESNAKLNIEICFHADSNEQNTPLLQALHLLKSLLLLRISIAVRKEAINAKTR